MSTSQPTRVYLITGGYPAGSPAGHDMDYARLRLLQLLGETPNLTTTVGNDFSDLAKWLPSCQLVITYVAGPHLNDEQSHLMQQWLEDGGRWLGLHGTSGGRAAPVGDDRRVRKMVKTSHHAVLGGFFLNHPPLCKFRVEVAQHDHLLTHGLPASFEVMDELYMIELQEPASSQILLTTELPTDPSPPGFGFVYDADTALLPDGKTRVLGYTRDIGKGGVAYIALGHCHSPLNNVQPFVDTSVEESGTTPVSFRGSWETAAFAQLVRNGIAWGSAQAV
ncbi:MAG: ThuA domain-containing protein [Desulfurellaceae bacterium]|nr:ThuA domain-containing protein [Desulfurellaceae bacterium]